MCRWRIRVQYQRLGIACISDLTPIAILQSLYPHIGGQAPCSLLDSRLLVVEGTVLRTEPSSNL